MGLDLRKVRYVPSIRTRGAELKGWAALNSHSWRPMLPLVELTLSRRSKTNPNGAISKTLEDVSEITKGRPFIADLTTLDRYKNSEIDKLLDPSENFSNWVRFAKQSLPSTCIPSVHLTLPFDGISFKRQAEALLESYDHIAVRIPTSYEEHGEVAESLAEMLGHLGRVIVIFDASLVLPKNISGASERIIEMISEWDEYDSAMIVPLASSFPSSVVQLGGDSNGKFSLSEVEISTRAAKSYRKLRIVHGDYGSIHPLDFEGTVTNWVPRVDVPLDSNLYYYRYRRDDGGYVRCAAEALEDPLFVDLDCWGCENIKDAAQGSPQGKSPSHWIAVRLNLHLSRQSSRLQVNSRI